MHAVSVEPCWVKASWTKTVSTTLCVYIQQRPVVVLVQQKRAPLYTSGVSRRLVSCVGLYREALVEVDEAWLEGLYC